MLIDFGAVKQLAAAVTQQFTSQTLTVLGKKGYTPNEQRRGTVYPSQRSLRSGCTRAGAGSRAKIPQTLYDGYQDSWAWSQVPTLSPRLAEVLQTMLQSQPNQRYQSAGAGAAGAAALSTPGPDSAA